MAVHLCPVVGQGGLGEPDLKEGVRRRLGRVEDCEPGGLVEALASVQAGKHLRNSSALHLVESGQPGRPLLVVVDAHTAEVVRQQVAHLLVEDLHERNLDDGICVSHLLEDAEKTPDEPWHDSKLLLTKGWASIWTNHSVGLAGSLD